MTNTKHIDWEAKCNVLRESQIEQEKLLQERNAEIKCLKVDCDRLREKNEELAQAWKELDKMYDILCKKHEKLKQSIKDKKEGE